MKRKMKKTKVYSHHSYLYAYSLSLSSSSQKPIGLAHKPNSKYPMGYFQKSRYYKRGYYKHLFEHYDYDVVQSIILNNRQQNKIKIVPVMFHQKSTPNLKTIRRRLMKAMGYRKR